MPSYRIDRISEEVRHALDSLIRQLNDPRIGGTWSVTRVEVTRDLRYAKTYEVDLRYTPELLFERDRNIAYGIHISQVLNDLKSAEEKTDETLPE